MGSGGVGGGGASGGWEGMADVAGAGDGEAGAESCTVYCTGATQVMGTCMGAWSSYTQGSFVVVRVCDASAFSVRL